MNKKMLSYGISATVLLSVLAMAMPVSAQVQMADEFGVEDAIGNPNTYVIVPVDITNVQNGPIATIIFDISYNSSVLSVVGAQKGDLISTWPTCNCYNIEAGRTRCSAAYDGEEAHAIQNTSTGSVVLLNFSVIGAPGASSMMNLTNIQFANTRYDMGTAPAKNGTFRVDAGAPIVINPTANPDTIVADGVQESELNVTVSDDIAIRDVTLDLAPIGGDLVHMNNIGNYTVGDVVWCIFNYTTKASIGTPPGIYHLQVNATDLLGNYNNTVSITLNVTLPPTGSIIGKITYSNNETGIAGVIVNLTEGSVVISTTTTNETGYYNFTDIDPGNYSVNASKPRFWDNSTAVQVNASETTTANMMLWVKGDLNNNGLSADAVDLLMMIDGSVGKITPDWRYDLNNNGFLADAVDLLMMIDASVGKIVLT